MDPYQETIDMDPAILSLEAAEGRPLEPDQGRRVGGPSPPQG